MNEITLSPLPYADNALEPTISSRTVSFHYGKHHAGYVNTLKGLVAGTKYEGLSLGEIVVASRAAGDTAVFNNAAQAWNHDFYWNSLAPEGKGGEPSAELLATINAAFGSLDACKTALADAAVKRFGSGWAWLLAKDGKVSVESTANADTPFVSSSTSGSTRTTSTGRTSARRTPRPLSKSISTGLPPPAASEMSDSVLPHMRKFDSMYDETPDDRCRRLEHELARQQLKTDMAELEAFAWRWKCADLFSWYYRRAADKALKRGDIPTARRYLMKAAKALNVGCFVYFALIIAVAVFMVIRSMKH